VAKQEGYNIKYVVADTGSTPSGTLAAAQKLVEQDHVLAVVAISFLTFAAAPYLTSHGVPVYGTSWDGSEWTTSKNMFSVYGYPVYTQVQTELGQLAKMLGGTNVAAIGYGISPSSAGAAKAFAVSAQAAGLKVGYLNPQLPFGTTNVGPLVLAMKNAHIDSLAPDITQTTGFAMIEELRREGVNLKVVILPAGGEGDLAPGGAAAEQVAQGVYFIWPYEPVEMQTAATERLQNALKTYAGVTGDPTAAEYIAYLSVDALVTGLRAAGPNPTQASLINAMLGITHYDGTGLFGSHSTGFSMSQRGQAAGIDNCTWAIQYLGSQFHVVSGADPICGSVVPGKSV
jgi:branched-chain amino acid transport system substrate-binding protein